jgi:integrase
MKINTLNRRKQLKPRGWPYWQPVAKGKAIGFHRTKLGGAWRARTRTPEGRHIYEALGGDLNSEYEDMLYKAQEWFKSVETVEDTGYSVKQCVADYVAHLQVENGPGSAKGVKQRLEKHLQPKLGKVELRKLTTRQLKSWHIGLVKTDGDPEVVRKSKDSANRILSQAKAAFNVAYRSGLVNSDTAWKRVSAFRDVGEARKLFLTDKQVNDLLKYSSGGFHDLVYGAVLTGARYGELASARVHDLDLVHGALILTGKTGSRQCYLADDALTFFRKLSHDKLPGAWLFLKDNGETWGKSHQHRPMKEAVQKAKLPNESVFYSLRHYHISKALLAGLPMQLIAENCGTSVRMIEKHYGKFLPEDRRAMLNKVALG